MSSQHRDYQFPYTPYEIQIDLMNKIYESLENGKISIIESPTGTGKSLSIICAVFKWIQDFKSSQSNNIEKKIKNFELDLQTSYSDDWISVQSKQLTVKNEIKDLKTKLDILNEHNQLCSTLKKKVKSTVHPEDALVYSTNNNKSKRSLEDEETESNLLVDYCDDTKEEKEMKPSYQPKFYFCTRTHSQIQQFVQEIKKTKSYKDNGSSLMSVVLASRANYCINPNVMSRDINTINEKCKDLQNSGSKCPMCKHSRLQQMSERILANVQDLEDIVKNSKTVSACPYYSSRMSIPDSEIVIMPYNILLHKATRESYGIDLKGSVVIIDEAHNLIETIANVHSVEIHLSQLETVLQCVTLYITLYSKRFSSTNLMFLKQLVFILKKFINFLGKQKKNESLDPLLFVIKLELEHINLFRIIEFIEKSHLAYKLRMFSTKPNQEQVNELNIKKSKNSGTLAFLNKIKKSNEKTKVQAKVSTDVQSTSVSFNSNILYNLKNFLVSIKDYSVNGKVLVSVNAENQNESCLKYILLDPSVHFKEVLTESRSVVLCGGTMQPFGDYINQLFKPLNINPDRYLTFSCGHVIEQENLIAIGCSRGVSNQVLNYNYSNRVLERIIHETGNVVSQLCSVIPKGVVVFFPSYEYSDFAMIKWQQMGVMNSIQKCKKVFFEKKSVLVSTVLNAYTQHINSSPTSGAILFSVIGGKMSEGINFSDDLGRGVIVIGLPFANKNSIELQEKMSFLEGIAPKAGNEYYENLCMKAVNQSIGRAIRHRNDFAAIVLLDERFSNTKIICKLPNWIQQRYKSLNQFQLVKSEINNFFQLKNK